MRRILLFLSFFLMLSFPAAASTTLDLTTDHSQTLTLQRPAASVFIANPDIADVQVLSPTRVVLFGKRTGETTFLATDETGATLADRTVVVSQDLSPLKRELDASFPGEPIDVKAVPGGIILSGVVQSQTTVADAYKIALRYMPTGGDIINRIQITGSSQILIRVRFAEVQKNIDNSLGFNWHNVLAAGDLTVGLATGSTIGTGSSIINTRPSNSALGMANNVFGVSGRTGNFSLNGVIDALEQEGLLTTLAEPTLTAMSGETANFLAGGEFPIPIPQDNGSISIEFRSYGISLAFTPTVLTNNRISLHVRPEVSELTDVGAVEYNDISVPALTTRKAETTVEVASGESFAIAGLMNNSQTQTVNKFPILGDLPILGPLFRSNHFVNGQTELVIIITPYVVRPSKAALALPTDGFSPPSTIDRLVGMRMSNSDPYARPLSGPPTAVRVSAPDIMISEPIPAPRVPVESEAHPSAPSPEHPLVLYTSEDRGGGGLLVE
ncbi:MAG: type II and III secretion system protein family protein [Alphaproteobacteria bacterium]|nr:type II and III secretion system protein family protein [Alphaproteobacteria bacterium]